MRTILDVNSQAFTFDCDMLKRLVLLHYNDVYNIEASESEPVGGASRLTTLVKGFSDDNPLVVFSGDALSPSLMSTATDGEQMIPVLNGIGTQIACIGNHDLDFGADQFEAYTKQWTFPWLLGNVFEKDTGAIPCGLAPTILKEWNGVKVGMLGLVDDDWLDTLGAVDREDIDYKDFVEVGIDLVQELRSEGAEIVIAVTHMRRPSDKLLLQQIPEIDVVLGGHDHDYSADYVEPHDNLLIKSGTEFRYLTRVEVVVDVDGKTTCTYKRLPVTGDVAEDPDMKAIVDNYDAQLSSNMDGVLGYTSVELDGRFSTVRVQETPLGNFVCDVLRKTAKAEICLFNSGDLRSDRIHPRGPLTRGDLLAILAYVDPTVVLKLTGQQLLDALENSVSKIEELAGRFMQVSGLKFSFDAVNPEGERVIKDSVFIDDRHEKLKVEESYAVCVTQYSAEGNDGFTVFVGAEVYKDEEVCPVTPPIISAHFARLRALTDLHTGSRELPKMAMKIATKMQRYLDDPESNKAFNPASPFVYEDEFESYAIAPVVERRITQILTR